MTLQFISDADTYLEFFERVGTLKDDNEKNRVNILMDMVKEGRKITVIKTKRTIPEIVEDYQKNYGDVLYVKLNEEEKDNATE
jgi:uncharacterized protein YpuA (DUF1002 family)